MAAAMTIAPAAFPSAGNDRAGLCEDGADHRPGDDHPAWVTATFVTGPESDQTLVAFYKRVHPLCTDGGTLAALVPELPEVRDGRQQRIHWGMGVIWSTGCLFAW